MTITFADCEVCGDDGFVWIPCVRFSTAHWRRKGETEFAVVAHPEQFRCPCDCARGKAWIEARRRGEELEE